MPKETSSLKTSSDARSHRKSVYDTISRKSREPDRYLPTSRQSSGASSSSYSARNYSGEGIKASSRPVNGRLNGRRHAEDGAITMAVAGPSRRNGRVDDAMLVCEASTSRPPVVDVKRRETYFRHIAVKKRGYPLLSPTAGVSIGDVGSHSPSGGFDVLFNVLLPADAPKNRGRVPSDFVPFTPTLSTILDPKPSGFLASPNVRRTDDTSTAFETTASGQGAILALPGGTRCEDLAAADIAALRTYVAAHVEGWYQHAAAGTPGPTGPLRNGDLRVVVGVDCAEGPWGVAAFSDAPRGSHLRLKPVGSSGSGTGMAEAYCWEYGGVAEVRAGTSPACVVVRTMNPRFNRKAWRGTSLPPSPQVEHPADLINRRLLDWSPSSRLVITEDHNWCSILHSDDEKPPSSALWERIKLRFLPRQADNGTTLFLEPMPKSTGSTYTPVPHPAPDPVKRPRHGKGSAQHFIDIHNKYHALARRFKHSGLARIRSVLSPLNSMYQPMRVPAAADSPYADHTGLFARLELLESVLMFTYATWIQEYGSQVYDETTWMQIEGLVRWSLEQWDTTTYANEGEEALIGLLQMMSTYLQSKILCNSMKKKIIVQVDCLHERLCKDIEAAAAVDPSHPIAASPAVPTPGDTAATPTKSDTPQHSSSATLPSRPGQPASNHSTPTKAHANATPTRSAQAQSLEVPKSKYTSSVSPSPSMSTPRSTGDDSTATGPAAAARSLSRPGAPSRYGHDPTRLREELVPRSLSAQKIAPQLMETLAAVPAQLTPALAGSMHDFTRMFSRAHASSEAARSALNLPILWRRFPRTWTRMMFSTLTAEEEHEPEYEDDEGELYWPSFAQNGEGLGWVCLMGRAMVKEFGAPFGYAGAAGLAKT